MIGSCRDTTRFRVQEEYVLLSFAKVAAATVLAVGGVVAAPTAPAAVAAPIAPMMEPPQPAELRLCLAPSGALQPTLPASTGLGPSSNYPDGPRTCSWNNKPSVKYYCLGGSRSTTIHIVSNRAGSNEQRRKIYPVMCDGQLRTLTSSTYPPLGGPYHVHWHLNAGTFTGAYLYVG
jgi:hypothetical protein